ncbi:hypothetical protein HME9302_01711 [Alteripontixanthobacter maritimus]|uniref:Peptidase S8/S53 domain-containing protein n=1 Tax=Alteripontixanthobacter maritimus TaxID=2161824 RepID=A0A369Q6K6_9SPHN|nr:S8 family serine peptidase [Alteripontixanthobacter maritimus]RDC60503.1 hypothetical protein HME9302_01711 [Alteripontixanthobacter maritimus]
MKSLLINAATAAIALSLASIAQASEVDGSLIVDSDNSEKPAIGQLLPLPLAPKAISALPMPVILPAVTAARAQVSDVNAHDAVPTFYLDTQALDAAVIQSPRVEQTEIGGVVEARSLVPYYGDINPFYGDIGAFWGDINPFWGDISPFYGDIGAFWGDIDAFWGDIIAFDTADLSALGDFWKNTSAVIETTDTLWGGLQYTTIAGNYVFAPTGTSPDAVKDSLLRLVADSEAKFGTAYTAEAGLSFSDGFAAELFARHGIDLDNLQTLANKSKGDRAAFFLDWHDSLMQYSGIDQVDHWMAATNWTPSVTHIQGSGADSVIGIIDGSFGRDVGDVTWLGGSTNTLGGHGAGVASLIVGKHDGKGVMGIAPNASITAYNPFSLDGTASWDTVATGIATLKSASFTDAASASVINMSLGEAGWVASQGLADVLARPDITVHNGSTVYVIAAGNDGVTQSTDIEWNFAQDTAAIFVGSVSPNLSISGFSNQAGTTCLLDNGVCHAGNELYNRFIVAPGEMLLMSDGQGGVVRRSGTSFAAPLVSGAITLLHDRWQWLAGHSDETAEIIFRSARDLGAPGVDPIYGWGMLDVTASQSPLDFSSMSFVLYEKRGDSYQSNSVPVSDLVNAGIPGQWETDDVFFTMFEDIGDTYRDFVVPMSSFTQGKRTNVLGGGYERMQDFISDRFARWIVSDGTDSNGDGVAGITQVRSNDTLASGDWTLRFDAMVPRMSDQGSAISTHSAATLTGPDGKLSFTLGHGQGSMALAGDRFGILSDHNIVSGGVNPVLGMASGEMFASASYAIAPTTVMRVGYSDNREEWHELRGLNPLDAMVRRSLGARDANAMTVDLEQRVAQGVSFNAQWTRLREDNALLGEQTAVDAFLGNGSATDAVTLSATIDIGSGLSFDMSATGGSTKLAGGQAFRNGADVWSTAGQITATKRGVTGASDTLRLSVAQPLNIEAGEIEFTSRQITDRSTGEFGVVTQTIGIEGKRRLVGEAVYAAPLGSNGEFGFFGRFETATTDDETKNYIFGGNVRLKF